MCFSEEEDPLLHCTSVMNECCFNLLAGLRFVWTLLCHLQWMKWSLFHFALGLACCDDSMSGISLHFQSSLCAITSHPLTLVITPLVITGLNGTDDVMRCQWSQVDYKQWWQGCEGGSICGFRLLSGDEVTIGGVEMRAPSDPCERESLCPHPWGENDLLVTQPSTLHLGNLGSSQVVCLMELSCGWEQSIV